MVVICYYSQNQLAISCAFDLSSFARILLVESVHHGPIFQSLFFVPMNHHPILIFLLFLFPMCMF